MPRSNTSSNTSPSLAPLQIVDSGNIEDLDLKPRNGRISVHTELFAVLAGLKKNEFTTVKVPSGQTCGTVSNRLTGAMKSKGLVPTPAGCYFSKRQTTSGDLAIMVVSKEDKKGRKAKAAKTTK